jgi:2-polyprenyl-3-methyl-5-hydroxy-6-metoxy-1,4-benzoquinol methylase
MGDNNESTEWDDIAGGWDDQPGVNEFSEHTKQLMLKQATPELWSSASVLDLGCGTGILSRLLSEHCGKIVSVDPSKAMVDVLQKHLDDNSSLGNISPISGILDDTMAEQFLKDEHSPFDAVVANSVCRFVPDYDDLLVRVRKLLKPGGLFVQTDWEQQKEPLTENHADGFHEEMLRKAYGKAGLDVVSIEQVSLMDNPIICGVSKNNAS